MRLTSVFLTFFLLACQQEPALEQSMSPVDEQISGGAAFGSWPSPISAASTVEGSRSLHTLYHDGEYLYWAEGRPEEAGRTTIMRWKKGGEPEELLPSPWNARTRVQEYGGRSILVADGTLWFTNFSDQRLYAMKAGEQPVAMTPELDIRFAACELDRSRDRLICIREDHRPLGEPSNALVAVPLNGESEGEVLFEGVDFVSAATLSPDGKSIAFVTWDHPNMPWDNTTLVSASFDESGHLSDVVEHNTDSKESVMDPQWSSSNELYAVSDRDNWWKLYRVNGPDFEAFSVSIDGAELGGPAWTLGRHVYRFLADGRVMAEMSQSGVDEAYLFDLETNNATVLDVGSAGVTDMLPVGGVIYLAHSPDQRPSELVAIEADDGGVSVIRTAKDEAPDPAWIPAYQKITFPTGKGEVAHGIYYPPTNPNVQAPEGDSPPLLVFIHGGPTSMSSPVYSQSKLYWTSRGFAILDVNYRGSTGYGRDYRQALYGQWGIADVEDAVAGARWLADKGLANADQLIIRGGSAGGYTTLAAHAFHNVFAAGASYFGVSDIEALAKETHKFESRYLDQLVGPYPERRDLYLQRSPINHLKGFTAPLLLLQGLDDKVVPPNQSEMIFEALKSRQIPTAYLPFEGEGHGFRKSENQIKALNAEYYFYARVLGLELAEKLEPIEIIGLSSALDGPN